VARTIHHGPYEGLADAWREFGQWVKAQGLDADTGFHECYLDDPTKAEPGAYRTEIDRILKD
jgi:effector-binding domain-containing protein